jgi:hypothetical protein
MGLVLGPQPFSMETLGDKFRGHNTNFHDLRLSGAPSFSHYQNRGPVRFVGWVERLAERAPSWTILALDVLVGEFCNVEEPKMVFKATSLPFCPTTI